MELIKLPTDMIAFDHEKSFRDLGSGFVGCATIENTFKLKTLCLE